MTTYDRIAEYLGCFEAGERIGVETFTQAYPMAEVKAALFRMRREDRIRLVAAALPMDYCDARGCDRADLIEGENEVFVYLETL